MSKLLKRTAMTTVGVLAAAAAAIGLGTGTAQAATNPTWIGLSTNNSVGV